MLLEVPKFEQLTMNRVLIGDVRSEKYEVDIIRMCEQQSRVPRLRADTRSSVMAAGLAPAGLEADGLEFRQAVDVVQLDQGVRNGVEHVVDV